MSISSVWLSFTGRCDWQVSTSTYLTISVGIIADNIWFNGCELNWRFHQLGVLAKVTVFWNNWKWDSLLVEIPKCFNILLLQVQSHRCCLQNSTWVRSILLPCLGIKLCFSWHYIHISFPRSLPLGCPFLSITVGCVICWAYLGINSCEVKQSSITSYWMYNMLSLSINLH